MLLRLLRAILNIFVGLVLALGLLEAVLRVNPTLLLRGMAAPASINAAVTVNDYAVHFSDGDLFFWHASLIRPLAPGQDAVAAQVHFATDELGFPNAGPLPAQADIIVLGRSFAQGANAADPWPRQVARLTGMAVVNLAQPASGTELKHRYLQKFGFPRRPRWVVLEVLPSLDILPFAPDPETIFESLPFPLAQTLARGLAQPPAPAASSRIYPIPTHAGAGTRDLVFFSYYLAALSVSQPDIEASRQWAGYQQAVVDLAADAHAHGACLALLYAPTKEELYFSVAADPQELAPALAAGWSAWRLRPDGNLANDADPPADAAVMQAQAGAARALVAGFAAAHQLTFVDPTAALQAAARHGDDPYMAYDTHWSAAGHTIVAAAVTQAVLGAGCR